MTSAGSGNGQGRLAQFIVGRIVVYLSVGLVEVTIITYQAEIVPAPLRGLVILSLQLFLNAGSLFATGMNKVFSTFTNNTGWLAVTGIQLLFPTRRSSFTVVSYLLCEAALSSYQSSSSSSPSSPTRLDGCYQRIGTPRRSFSSSACVFKRTSTLEPARRRLPPSKSPWRPRSTKRPGFDVSKAPICVDFS